MKIYSLLTKELNKNVIHKILILFILCIPAFLMAQTAESEPNDGCGDAGTQTIEFQGTFSGTTSSSDNLDVWNLASGISGSLTLTVNSYGNDIYNINIYGADDGNYCGNGADQYGWYKGDGPITVTLDPSHKYSIMINQDFMMGGPDGAYNFTLSGAALPLQIFAPTSQPTNLLLTQTDNGYTNFKLDYTASNDATSYLISRKTGSAPTFAPSDGTTYTANLPGGQTAESEPNGYSEAGIKTIQFQGTYYGTTSSSDDLDVWYLAAGTSGSLTLTVNSCGNDVQYINIYGSDDGNYNGNGADQYFWSKGDGPLTVTLVGSHKYSIMINQVFMMGGPDGAYNFSLSGAALSVPSSGAIDDGILYLGPNVTFTDPDVTIGVTYYYKIYAFNGTGSNTKYLTTNPLSGNTIINSGSGSTIGSTSEPTFSGFPSAGITITFPAGTSGTTLNATKTSSSPSANFQGNAGVRGMSPLYFTITSSNGTPGNYTIVLDFSSLGLTEAQWARFKVMKRADASSYWKDITGAPYNATIVSRQTDGVWGKFTISGLSSFSEFGGGVGAYTVTNNADAGANTLRGIIADAAVVDGDVIEFDVATMGSNTITLSTTLIINKNLTIVALGSDGGVILEGGGSVRVMDIADAKLVTLKNMKIQNGFDDTDLAGGIWNNGNLTMINCVVSANKETNSSLGVGGILQFSGTGDDVNDVLTLINCTITNNDGTNSSAGGTGGLMAVTGTTNLRNTIIYGNIGDTDNDIDINTTLDECNNSCIGNLGSITITLGSNNISSDPQFVTASGSATHPYSISGSSPCADTGNDSYNSETTDIKGSGRKLLKTDGSQSGTIDIGAYESDSESPLPVELITFTAASTSSATGEPIIVLTWQTATEVNNYGFEIERQILNQVQNDNWEKIGFVQGSGNSNSPKSYEFIDYAAPTGKLKYRLKQIDTDGKYEYFGTIAEVVFGITDIQVDEALPTKYELSQNYPNPFNPSTVINFQLPNKGFTSLKVYDILGREVAVLVNEEKVAGKYSAKFDASNLTSGIYFSRLTSGNYSSIKKMLLIK